MRDILDIHTHTIASGHAYSTIREMTAAAREKGLELLGISEHAPKMPGSCHEFYFSNLKILDRQAYGIPVIFGAELNIINKNGDVDLDERYLKDLDYCIASFHPSCVDFMNQYDTTNAVIRAMQNPYVQIIGHPDDSRYPLDYDRLAAAASEHGVLLEVNNASLAPKGFRVNAANNYEQMLAACKKYNTKIIMSSDAHVDTLVGAHDYALQIISQCDFPEELVINSSPEAFLSFIAQKKKRHGFS